MLNVDEGDLFWIADARFENIVNKSSHFKDSGAINSFISDLGYKTFIKSGMENSVEKKDGLTVITLEKSTNKTTFCWPKGF